MEIIEKDERSAGGNMDGAALLGKRILIMTAVEAERAAVLRGLAGATGFDVELAGVGPISAAARTAAFLAASSGEYSLVISAGIGGGIDPRAEIGSVVVASEVRSADLGVETAEGFRTLDQMNFGSNLLHPDQRIAALLEERLRSARIAVMTGPVLTVSTATGTVDTAASRSALVPNAAVEAMEGYGVAFAAQEAGIPFAEIRSISNRVGPRDLSAWRMKEAFSALEAASSVLREVFS